MKTPSQRLRLIQTKYGHLFTPAVTTFVDVIWDNLKDDNQKHKFLDELDRGLHQRFAN